MFYPIGGLLKLSNFSYDVRNLQIVNRYKHTMLQKYYFFVSHLQHT